MAAASGSSGGGGGGGGNSALGGAALGMQLGAAIGSAYAAYSSARSSQKISAFNAKVGEMQAKWAEERGIEAIYRHRLRMRGFRGSQRASFAGQNVVVDEGTALEAQEETAKWTEVDALTLKNNATLEAWGFRMQAANSSMQGALNSPLLAGTSTLLTGLGSTATNAYLMFGKQGGGGGQGSGSSQQGK